jgi:hypothetical protein
MSYKEARRGAAIAGAVLFAMPVVEVYYGFGTPGPVHSEEYLGCRRSRP